MAEASVITEAIRKAVGVESTPRTHAVEAGAVRKFAEAIGDDNPLFNDEEVARRSPYGGLIAPPTFLRSAKAGRPDLPFDIPFERALDGGSDWEYFEPVRPGDRITAVAHVSNITERAGRLGPMLITTVVITYRNQFDQVAATQTATSIRY